jgi:hypothetical protein
VTVPSLRIFVTVNARKSFAGRSTCSLSVSHCLKTTISSSGSRPSAVIVWQSAINSTAAAVRRWSFVIEIRRAIASEHPAGALVLGIVGLGDRNEWLVDSPARDDRLTVAAVVVGVALTGDGERRPSPSSSSRRAMLAPQSHVIQTIGPSTPASNS